MTTFNVLAARLWSPGWRVFTIALLCATAAAGAREVSAAARGDDEATGQAAGQAQPPAGVRSLLRMTRSAIVTATGEPITVDGALDEPAWHSSPDIGDLIQREPRTGAAPSERTEVTLLHDQNYLYVGVVAYDSEPHRVIGTQMMRDASLNSDDRIEILLDTFRDRRNAFYFATNPSGALVDGIASDGQLNTDWDAIWDVRTARTEQGWVAEFAIPFKSLSFPAGPTAWGFNIARTIYRKLEEDRWSGARLQTDFLQLSEAGEITQLDRLTQGIGLDLRPFFAGDWLYLDSTGSDDFRDKPGLDLSYNITSSLKLTGTFNTDFGETEVDERQINLSRFSLFFPEKRSFFLEDAGVFGFASLGPEPPGGIPEAGADVYPFFSRRIGLLEGEEVPLDAGIKLTGKVGRTDVGMLGVRTGDLAAVVDENNLFVGRVKRNLFRQSYVGAIFTAGDPALGQSAQTYGADLRLATSQFLGSSRNLDVNAYAVRGTREARSDKDWSYGFSARFPNDLYDAQVVLREVQENFDPALGFVQRSNVRMLRVAGSYNPRPRNLLNVQQMSHDVFYTRFTRLDNGEVESWDLYITWFDWHFNSGDNIHGIMDLNPTYERLFEPFEISPGVILAPGEYRFTRFKTNLFSTAQKRPLSGSATVVFGNFWSGTATEVTAGITYKLPPRFMIELDMDQTFARLPEGHFTARIFTSRVSYSASPRLSFSNLVQYDNRSRNLGWQSRIRWTLQPGNDLFIAFNQGWIHEEGDNLRFRTQDTKASAKFQYTFRF
jgi:hypothetical protein